MYQINFIYLIIVFALSMNQGVCYGDFFQGNLESKNVIDGNLRNQKKSHKKYRLTVLKKGNRFKSIRQKKKIKVWLNNSEQSVEGRYHIIDEQTIRIDTVSIKVDEISRISTINIYTIIGITSVLGGSAHLLVIPGKALASFAPIDGKVEPFETPGGICYLDLH